MFEQAPHFAKLDEVTPADAPQAAAGQISGEAFDYAVGDFYFTNPIARASATMADCAKAKEQRGSEQGTGTDG